MTCGGEGYENFRVSVRNTDFKKIKVSVKNSYTGKTETMVFPVKNINDHLDSYVTSDGYTKLSSHSGKLAQDHNLQGSVKFVSYLFSPDIYVGRGSKRHRLADLFNEHKKSVMACNYSQTPDLIKIHRETYCFGRGSCTIDNRNISNRPFFCMAKGSRCPDATACAVEDKEKKYTNNNW